MKLDKIIEFDSDEIAIIQNITEEEKKTLLYQFSILPYNGQKYYKIDLKTMQVSELDSTDYQKQVLWLTSLTKMPKIKQNIALKENHLYTTALNMENAINHFRKMLLQGKTPHRILRETIKL